MIFKYFSHKSCRDLLFTEFFLSSCCVALNSIKQFSPTGVNFVYFGIFPLSELLALIESETSIWETFKLIAQKWPLCVSFHGFIVVIPSTSSQRCHWVGMRSGPRLMFCPHQTDLLRTGDIVVVFVQGQLSAQGFLTLVKVTSAVGIVPATASPITKDYPVVCITRFWINNSPVVINFSVLTIPFIEI